MTDPENHFDQLAKLLCSNESNLDTERNITCSVESQAPCYFFASYALKNGADSTGCLDYLPGFCEGEAVNDFLMEAVGVLSLASLAIKRQRFEPLEQCPS